MKNNRSKKIIVIGLTGAQGSGKDTAADLLVKNHQFIRLGFSDPLYEQVSLAFNQTIDFLKNRDTKETPLLELSLQYCKDERFKTVFKASYQLDVLETDPISPRDILRCWGTEYRRIDSGNDAYWIDRMMVWMKESGALRVAIPDLRFNNNEAPFVRQFSLGSIWHIDSSKRGLTAKRDHSSDLGITFFSGVDQHLDNSGNLIDLETNVHLKIQTHLNFLPTKKILIKL